MHSHIRGRQRQRASFTINGEPEPFEIYFDTDMIRALMECGNAALADLNAKMRTKTGQHRSTNTTKSRCPD